MAIRPSDRRAARRLAEHRDLSMDQAFIPPRAYARSNGREPTEVALALIEGDESIANAPRVSSSVNN